MEKSKVAVVACPDYEPARVKESLQKGLEAIGGLESLIGKEENILLKPNLVRSAKTRTRRRDRPGSHGCPDHDFAGKWL